jgi:hypothetical protein
LKQHDCCAADHAEALGFESLAIVLARADEAIEKM